MAVENIRMAELVNEQLQATRRGLGQEHAGLMFGVLPAIWVFQTSVPLIISGICAALILGMNFGLFRVLFRSAGLRVALVSVPLLILFYFASGLSAISGWLAYSLVGAPIANGVDGITM